MKALAEQLREYFRTTPKDVIQKEREAIHEEFGYGWEASEYIEASRGFMANNPLNNADVVFDCENTGNFKTDPLLGIAA